MCDQYFIVDGDHHRWVRGQGGAVLEPGDLGDRGGVHVANDLRPATQLDADRLWRDADLPLDICGKEERERKMKIKCMIVGWLQEGR